MPPFEPSLAQVGEERLVALGRFQQKMPRVLAARQGLGVEVAADDAGLSGGNIIKRATEP
ncbi:hypothetical protein VB618_01540 [Microvirga sp. CF3062]|nr:hypothetical protein [Microvirga sp. CF3062]MEE1654863.1 hypothetical protein [Microvirga sp. CF3062]